MHGVAQDTCARILNYSSHPMLGFSSALFFFHVGMEKEGGTPRMTVISVSNSHILFQINFIPCFCRAEFTEAVKNRVALTHWQVTESVWFRSLLSGDTRKRLGWRAGLAILSQLPDEQSPQASCPPV